MDSLAESSSAFILALMCSACVSVSEQCPLRYKPMVGAVPSLSQPVCEAVPLILKREGFEIRVLSVECDGGKSKDTDATAE